MNEHSPKYQIVKDHYDHHEWSKKAVKNAVKRQWITESEYLEITGEVYTA
jgi:hypothetical protein